MRAGVPYRVVGGVKFYDRREVKDILAYLRALVNPDDEVSWRRVVEHAQARGRRHVGQQGRGVRAGRRHHVPRRARARRPPRASPARRSAASATCSSSWSGSRRSRSAASAPTVEAILEQTGYLAELEAERSIEARGRIENLQELVGVCHEFDQALDAGDVSGLPGIAGVGTAETTAGDVVIPTGPGPHPGVPRGDLARHRPRHDAEGDGGDQSAVTLMTLHTAKGLEFPVVFLTGMEDGVFPHARSLGDPDELEEERRLCYVGITRARERLYLCHAWSRMLFGATDYYPPSRFLSEIPEELVHVLGAGAERAPTAASSSGGRDPVEHREAVAEAAMRPAPSAPSGPTGARGAEGMGLRVGDDVEPRQVRRGRDPRARRRRRQGRSGRALPRRGREAAAARLGAAGEDLAPERPTPLVAPASRCRRSTSSSPLWAPLRPISVLVPVEVGALELVVVAVDEGVDRAPPPHPAVLRARA